jgi:hypothetical protein
MDEFHFALWPIWSTSRRVSVQGTSILWPIYNRSRGKHSYRFRVFPLYGYLNNEGRYEKRFVLWPIWTWTRYAYSDSSGSGHILFPLWGRMKLTDQSTWWLIPPFFRFTKSEKLNVTYCPWPLFQKESGKDVQKLYLWPFWGGKEYLDNHSWFALWPFFHYKNVTLKEGDIRQFTFVPLVQSIAVRARTDSGLADDPRSRYFKLWPLMSYQRDADQRRLRFLELWPLRNSRPIERNLAPFWTFYEWRTAAGNADHELLWGLYRRKTRGEEYTYTSIFPLVSWEGQRGAGSGRSWSILKGLVEYRRKDTQKSFRLLYFLRFGRDSVQTAAEEDTTIGH